MELLQALALLFSMIVHDVGSTSLVKGGEIHITTPETSAETVHIRMDYHLKMKWYAPVKDQRGTLSQELPAEFVDERGYIDLEREGTREFKNVLLTHLGRRDCLGLKRCHRLKVERNDGKWDAEIDYHPTIASTGWAQLALTYKNIPAIGKHTVRSKVRL